MSITNNRASFYLGDLVKHLKITKYCAHDCLQNLLSLFMSLLTAKTFKNSNILVGIYFIYLQKSSRPNLDCFHLELCISVKVLRR